MENLEKALTEALVEECEFLALWEGDGSGDLPEGMIEIDWSKGEVLAVEHTNLPDMGDASDNDNRYWEPKE